MARYEVVKESCKVARVVLETDDLEYAKMIAAKFTDGAVHDKQKEPTNDRPETISDGSRGRGGVVYPKKR